MFDGQREFRAIVFESKGVGSVEDVTSLIPSGSIAEELTEINGSNNFSIRHGYFYSATPFAPPEVIAEVHVPFGGAVKYRYDFYACKWKSGRRTAFVVAVPFAKMAKEMFAFVDGSKSRKYRKINLQALIEGLAGGGDPSRTMTATTIRFAVTGGDRVRRATLSGPDVTSSQVYQRLTESLHGIALLPRRVRVRFDDDRLRATCEADLFGNYWFHVSKGGGNLVAFGAFLDALQESKVLEDAIAYPLREEIEDGEE